MRSRVTRAVYAGVLATISVAALFAPPSLDRLRWLLVPLAVPAIPAHLATMGNPRRCAQSMDLAEHLRRDQAFTQHPRVIGAD
jgi:hypothetical protein